MEYLLPILRQYSLKVKFLLAHCSTPPPPAAPVPLTEPQRKAIYDAVQGLDVMKAILMTEAAYGSTEKGRS
jgi:hypothetical protein